MNFPVLPTSKTEDERSRSSPLGQPILDERQGLADQQHCAPIIGDVVNTFRSQLDPGNLLRLPTLCADAGILGPFWLAAASISGLSKLHNARTCQDSYSFALSHDTHGVAVAVADGLGSHPTSAQLGSVLLARSICQRLSEQRIEDLARAPMETITDAVEAANAAVQVFRTHAFPAFDDQALSATVAFAWIPVNSDDMPAVAGQIGDCAVFTLIEKQYSAVFPPENGPRNKVNACLPSSSPADILRLRTLSLKEQRCLIVASDGLANDIFDSPAVRGWLADRWARRPTAFHMLESLRYRRQGSHDDRTAAVVWLDPPAPEQAFPEHGGEEADAAPPGPTAHQYPQSGPSA